MRGCGLAPPHRQATPALSAGTWIVHRQGDYGRLPGKAPNDRVLQRVGEFVSLTEEERKTDKKKTANFATARHASARKFGRRTGVSPAGQYAAKTVKRVDVS